ncbi:hypothetical protein DsansV1_C24g0183671 [Dioscorea sansibarensis]
MISRDHRGLAGAEVAGDYCNADRSFRRDFRKILRPIGGFRAMHLGGIGDFNGERRALFVVIHGESESESERANSQFLGDQIP